MTKNLSLKTVKIKIRSNMDNKGTLAGGLFIALVVLGIIAFNVFTYGIDQGEVAVLKNTMDGNLTYDTEAGLNTKGFFDKVLKISTSEKTYSREDTANTSDNVQLTYETKVTYTVVDAQKFYETKFKTEDEAIQAVINKDLTKALDTVSNKYTYDYIKSNIASIGDQITASVNTTLKNYGLEVRGVNIVGIKAPESIDKAINAKISKQQTAEASKYEVEKAQNEAKAQKVRQSNVSAEQQQINLCQSAIDKGNAYSPACYFGQGIYVAGSNK